MIKKFLSIFCLISLFVNPLYAQELPKDVIYVWDDFSKGLNLKLSPNGLPKGWAITSENIRLNSELKSLKKRNEIVSYGSMDASEAVTGMHRLYLSSATKVLIGTHGDEIEKGTDSTGAFTTILALTSGNYRWQWLTWHDLAIGTDGYNQPVKYDGTTATYLGTCAGVDSAAGSGPVAGTYTYKVSYYTTSYEVIFNVASASVVNGAGDHDVSLTQIPIAPTTYGGESVTGRKIYRNKLADQTHWFLLSAASGGTIANNTATTLTDTDTDAELTATAYPADTATYTPPKGKLCVIHKNRLWIAGNPTYPSRLYYSEDGLHDVFVSTAYFDIRLNDGDDITFIKNLLGKLIVGKSNTIQRMNTDGDTPSSDWGYSDPLSHTGCRAPYSATNTPLGIFYLSNDGIYKFNGQYSTLASNNVTPVIKDISPTNYAYCWGALHENTYYLAYTSQETGATANDRVLVYDLLTDAFSIDLIAVNAFCTFSSGTDWDVLYSGSSANGTISAHAGTAVNDITHKTHSDFSGTFDDARYIPTTVGGDANDPVIELSWDLTINGVATTINNTTGDINRPDIDGSYLSPVLYTGASSYDKLYWNEIIPACGGDVTFDIRTGPTTPVDGTWSAWTTGYSDPSGTDISALTANSYVQYKINLSTNDIDYTPTVYRAGYVVRITYNKEGVTAETTIPLHWTSGYDNLGYPGYTKSLKKIYVFYESAGTGILTIKFTNLEGLSDTFAIDLVAHPSRYIEYFTGGSLLGESFTLDVQESSLHPITIKKVICTFDIQPLALESP